MAGRRFIFGVPAMQRTLLSNHLIDPQQRSDPIPAFG